MSAAEDVANAADKIAALLPEVAQDNPALAAELAARGRQHLTREDEQ